MKTIWKYSLTAETTIEMPMNAQVLTVQAQDGGPQLWALVDPSALKCVRTFRMYGTGIKIRSNPGQYIGSLQIADEFTFVFHVFETTEQPDPRGDPADDKQPR